MDLPNKHLVSAHNKVTTKRLFELEEPLSISNFQTVIDVAESLVELGFESYEISLTYQNTNKINDLLLSLDWFNDTRAVGIEVFFDEIDDDTVTVLVRVLLTHAPNGIVNLDCFNVTKTFGPFSGLRELFSDFETYENLRRCAHQITFNKNKIINEQ